MMAEGAQQQASEVLSAGDLVELHGLVGAKELNLRWGRVLLFDAKTSRYGIKVDGVKEPKSIKLDNLRKLRSANDSAPTDVNAKSPMPAAFMESIPGTPIFKVLLKLLPAETLLALTCCQQALCKELKTADEAWVQALELNFGGTFDMAKSRFAGVLSPHSAVLELADLKRRLATVEVIQGDLADAATLGVDAVIYAANFTLEPYGPAARAIFFKAGEELTEHMATVRAGLNRPELSAGSTIWTPSFGLGTPGLVHAVGPDRQTENGDQKLHEVYSNALQEVISHGHQSVAIGSISTGGNGFTDEIGAAVAAEEIRNLFARLGRGTGLRIVIVLFEPPCKGSDCGPVGSVPSASLHQRAFDEAFTRIRDGVNGNLLDELPLLVLDSMLPGQRLCVDASCLPVAVPESESRFAMFGGSRGGGVASHGVEVHLRKREVVGTTTKLEFVAGRCLQRPGQPNLTDRPLDSSGRRSFSISVSWVQHEHDASPADVRKSASLEPLVSEWLGYVRARWERQPGQMDQILEDLGPMPPAEEVTNRALWVCALINPLPALGVAYEVRPAALKAQSDPSQVAQVALEGITRSIEHVSGRNPL